MLRSFSMSWNAMLLVLLTLYSVIHFIINSLPNVIVSVLIEDIQLGNSTSLLPGYLSIEVLS